MKRILLPTDFSPSSRHAIEYATRLYTGDTAQYILFHSIAINPASTEGMYFPVQELTDEAEENLEAMRDELQLMNEDGSLFTTEVSSSFSQPVTAILDYVKKNQVDVIVMGTKGVNNILDKLIGSTAEGVLRGTSIPCVAVPDKAPIKAPARITFASDYKPITSEGTLDMLRHLARKHRAMVNILHVTQSDVLIGSAEAMEGIKLHYDLEGIDHDYYSVMDENTASGIQHFVEEKDSDMVAVLSRHDHFWDRLFHSSVTKKLANEASIPILVMHEENQD